MNDIGLMMDPDVRREQNKKYAKKEAEEGCYSVGLGYKNGIVIVSHNKAADMCCKIREVHKNSAIVGAGRTSDIEQVTETAISEADITELRYSDKDVVTKNLAKINIARYVRERFNSGEPACAIMLLGGIDNNENRFYKIVFDGEVIVCENFVSIGGKLSNYMTNWIEDNCEKNYTPEQSLEDAILFGVDCIVQAIASEKKGKTDRADAFEQLGKGSDLEVAVLDRTILDVIKFAPITKDGLRHELAPMKYERLQELFTNFHV